jgi:hypothetical protein
MAKDNRYKAVKAMFDMNNFKSFKELFDIIPKSVVATDLGIHYNRFVTKISKPEDFSLQELIMLSNLIEVTPAVLIDLAMKDIESKKKRIKK